MALLTSDSRIVATRLLDWDRDRVARREAQGYDVTVYKGRQRLALTCLDLDVAAWPLEVRYIFMTVLEVLRTPNGYEHGIGPVRIRVPRLTRAERAAFRAMALEIGVLANLREVAPRHWGDVDSEGD